MTLVGQHAGLRPDVADATSAGSVAASPELDPALRQKLELCSTLPSLPAVAIRVLQLCQSDDLDLAQIAATIGKDPALSSRGLRSADDATRNRSSRTRGA